MASWVWPTVFFPKWLLAGEPPSLTLCFFSFFFLHGTSIPYSKPPFWWVSEFEPLFFSYITQPSPKTIISKFHPLFQPSYPSFIPYSKPPFWWVFEFEPLFFSYITQPSPIPTIISEFHPLFQPSYPSFIPYSNHRIRVSSPIPTIISGFHPLFQPSYLEFHPLFQPSYPSLTHCYFPASHIHPLFWTYCPVLAKLRTGIPTP